MATEKIQIDWEKEPEIPEFALCYQHLDETNRALVEATATDILVNYSFLYMLERALDFSSELKKALERIGVCLINENRVAGLDLVTMVLLLKELKDKEDSLLDRETERIGS